MERFSLVPYDDYRNSLISVHRSTNLVSRDSLRRSNLFEQMPKMQAEDPSLKNLSVNKSKMLDFFGGAKNSQSSASQVTDANKSKRADDLQRNTSIADASQWCPDLKKDLEEEKKSSATNAVFSPTKNL